jgi:hypothetical protein
VAGLDGRHQVATDGSAVFAASIHAPPLVGALTLRLPGTTRPVQFARHTYWPGARYSFAPGA